MNTLKQLENAQAKRERLSRPLKVVTAGSYLELRDKYPRAFAIQKLNTGRCRGLIET